MTTWRKIHIAIFTSLMVIFLILAVHFKFFRVAFSFTVFMFTCFASLMLVFLLLELYELKKPKRAVMLRRMLILLLLAGLALFTAALIPVVRSAKTDNAPAADYLIILGAGLHGAVPSVTLVDRLEAALSYLDEYPDALAIVSGGQGPDEEISEAEAMALWLERRGIAAERIIREDRSTSTYENIAFSLEIITERGDREGASIAVLTSEYHVYRAKEYARALGAEVVGVAAKTTYRVVALNYFIREACGVVYMWVFGA